HPTSPYSVVPPTICSPSPCFSHPPHHRPFPSFPFFFFNDTATTEIYTLSLHDALPIFAHTDAFAAGIARSGAYNRTLTPFGFRRSEEHTSELQSLTNLVCRLLLEKKKNKMKSNQIRQNDRINV